MAIIGMQRPRVIALPRENGDIDGAKAWEPVLQYFFEKQLRMSEMRLIAKVMGSMDGHYAGKVYWEARPDGGWNAKAQEWEGTLDRSLVRNEYLICDPEAESNLQKDIEYIGTYRKVRVSWAKQRWLEHADKIDEAAKQERIEGPYSNLTTGFHITGVGSAAALDGSSVRGERGHAPGAVVESRLSEIIGLIVGDRQPDILDDGDDPTYLMVLEMWFKDRTIERGKEIKRKATPDEAVASGEAYINANEVGAPVYRKDTNEPLTEGNWPTVTTIADAPKYPNGRYVLRVGKDVILEDKAWPHKNWPFAIGTNIPLPMTWHGLNNVENARTLQDRVNYTATHEMNWLKFQSDPVTMAERGAIAGDPDNRHPEKYLAARAGAFWGLEQGGMQKVKREAPPPLAGGLVKLHETYAKELQDQTGSHESFRGRAPDKATTATEISMLQTNSQMRTGLQSTQLDTWTVRMMEIAAEQLRVNLKPGQMVRIIGQDDNEGQIEITQRMLDAEYDLKMEVGAALPYDKERLQQRDLQLFQLLGMPGAAVNPYLANLLKSMEVENADEIIARMQEMLMMQQQAMAAQQQPPAAEQQVAPEEQQGAMPMSPEGLDGYQGGMAGAMEGAMPQEMQNV
jgi:hypothetical protein